MKLSDISDIYLGIIQKRNESISRDANSKVYKMFSLKCYDENIEYENFYANRDLTENLTRKGDLLFRLVYPNRIVVVDEKAEGLVVNNQFCIIRCTDFIKYKNNAIFLKWYLESDDARKQLEKYLIGTAAKSVPVAKLRELCVPDISMEKTEKITNFITKWLNQKELYAKIVEEKERYYNKVISNILKRENKNEY